MRFLFLAVFVKPFSVRKFVLTSFSLMKSASVEMAKNFPVLTDSKDSLVLPKLFYCHGKLLAP